MSKKDDYRKRYTITLTEKERRRLLNTQDTHLASIQNKLYDAKGVKRKDEAAEAENFEVYKHVMDIPWFLVILAEAKADLAKLPEDKRPAWYAQYRRRTDGSDKA